MTRIDTAVILAAGRGMRMGADGRERPKGFIRFGDRPIIEESVLRLRVAGISRILVVTGHLSEQYEAFARGYPGLITLDHNPDFGQSGSMYSLSMLRGRIDSQFLLLDSDLVYEGRALQETIDHDQENVILVSQPTGSQDEVFVQAPNGLLRNLSKDSTRLNGDILGEMVGITKLSVSAFHAMVQSSADVFKRTLHLEYEQALLAIAPIIPLHCHLVPDLIWAEVDTADHFERVKRSVCPRIPPIPLGVK